MASLSLDLDNKWSYLKTRGDARWTALPSYLDTVVPRFLSVLQDLGLEATVFVVGQDAVLGGIARRSSRWSRKDTKSVTIPFITIRGCTCIPRAGRGGADGRRRSYRTVDRGATARVSRSRLQPLATRIGKPARRGYQYDATTLPTFLGPLARQYYLLTAELDHKTAQRASTVIRNVERGFVAVRAYWWEFDAEAIVSADAPSRLLEIPVTTMPLLRTPFHLSYLLYLRQYSASLAWTYWRLAMRLCSLRGVPPSLLLHPLDFLGGEDVTRINVLPGHEFAVADKSRFRSCGVRGLRCSV